MMAKAALLVGALCAITTVDAFLPTCTRATVTPCRATSTRQSVASLSAVQQLSGVSKPHTRAARTSLFSAPAASNEATAAATPLAVPAPGDSAKKSPGPLKVGSYFGLWYLFNIGYNIYNKRVLNVVPLPWCMAWAQMGIGLLYVLPLWATKLRKAPKLAKGSLGPLR